MGKRLSENIVDCGQMPQIGPTNYLDEGLGKLPETSYLIHRGGSRQLFEYLLKTESFWKW